MAEHYPPTDHHLPEDSFTNSWDNFSLQTLIDFEGEVQAPSQSPLYNPATEEPGTGEDLTLGSEPVEETVEEPYEPELEEDDSGYEAEYREAHKKEKSASEKDIRISLPDDDMDLRQYAKKLHYGEKNSLTQYWESFGNELAGLETILDVQDQLGERQDDDEFKYGPSPEELEAHTYNLIERYFQEKFDWEGISFEKWLQSSSSDDMFQYIYESDDAAEKEVEAFHRLRTKKRPLTWETIETHLDKVKDEVDLPL